MKLNGDALSRFAARLRAEERSSGRVCDFCFVEIYSFFLSVGRNCVKMYFIERMEMVLWAIHMSTRALLALAQILVAGATDGSLFLLGGLHLLFQRFPVNIVMILICKLMILAIIFTCTSTKTRNQMHLSIAGSARAAFRKSTISFRWTVDRIKKEPAIFVSEASWETQRGSSGGIKVFSTQLEKNRFIIYVGPVDISWLSSVWIRIADGIPCRTYISGRTRR